MAPFSELLSGAMMLEPEDIDHIAMSLLLARRTGAVCHEAGLHRLMDIAEAEDVQEAILCILGEAQVGYGLSATSHTTSRLLHCTEPVIAPLLRRSVQEDGSTFRLPHGVLGLGAGFCFTLGRPLENPSDGADGESEAADVCIACHIELHLLGR